MTNNSEDARRPSNKWQFLFTRDDVESVQSDDLPNDWEVADDEPVVVVLNAGQVTHTFWKAEGGVEPSYNDNANGTLTVWRGNLRHVMYGPSAWLLVRGPQRLP